MKDLLEIEQEVEAMYHWDEHPAFPVADWKYEVANDDTRESYKHWLINQIANQEDQE